MKKILYVIFLALILSSYNAMAAKGVSDKHREFLNNNNQQQNFKSIRFDKFHFIPTHMSGKLGAFHKNNPQATLEAFLKKNGDVFRFTDRTELNFIRSRASENGISHHFFSQSIDDVPVKGIRISMHSNTNSSQIERINAYLVSEEDIVTTPNITLAQAELMLEGELNANKVLKISKSELVLSPIKNKPAELVWSLNVQYFDAENAMRDEAVYINALTGNITFSRSNILYAYKVQIWDAQDNETVNTALQYRVLASAGSIPTPLAPVGLNDAANISKLNGNFEKAYDYFNGRGWTSYDSFDKEIKASINKLVSTPGTCDKNNVCNLITSTNNASFSQGNAIPFGFGSGTAGQNAPWGNALDVVAHEFTHGVSYYKEGDTLYGQEASAIGESLGDIFASVIETLDSTGNLSSPNDNTWRMFESVSKPSDLTVAARYMDDPKKKSDDTGNDNDAFDYYPDFKNSSTGAPAHAVAGISNLAFYLLSHGGDHPRRSSVVVNGVGLATAINIFWEAFDNMTLQNTGDNYSFSKWRQATALAAKNLNLPPHVQEEVCKAWDVVGVEGKDKGHCATEYISLEWLGCIGNTPEFLATWFVLSPPDIYDVNYRLTTSGSYSSLYYGTSTSKTFTGKPYMPTSVQMRSYKNGVWSPYIGRIDPTTSCLGGGL